MACAASPIKYQKNPIHTLDTCFLGTKNLLELAKEKKSIFFHASTSEVYGDPLVHPQKESYFGNVNTMGPRSCYDEGKRIAETLCYEYGKFSINKIKLARIFNTYGPYMSKDDGRVVSNLINQALENKDLTINGDGKQTRSFCYIDDLVKGIISLANYKENLVTPINLGNPFEFTILELANNYKKN